MSTFAKQVHEYQLAQAGGDNLAAARVLAEIPARDLETFLSQVQASSDAEPFTPTPASLEASLERAGFAPHDATLLSILSTGSFEDFVRVRFRANSLNADSVLQSIDDSDDALSAEEQDDLAAWLEAVLDGETPTDQLPTRSISALARACGASTDTMLSMLERTPHKD